MNLSTAKSLKQGEILIPLDWQGDVITNADGKTPQHYRVTSVKTWKTRPNEVRVRALRGLRDHIELAASHVAWWLTEAEYNARTTIQ